MSVFSCIEQFFFSRKGHLFDLVCIWMLAYNLTTVFISIKGICGRTRCQQRQTDSSWRRGAYARRSKTRTDQWNRRQARRTQKKVGGAWIKHCQQRKDIVRGSQGRAIHSSTYSVVKFFSNPTSLVVVLYFLLKSLIQFLAKYLNMNKSINNIFSSDLWRTGKIRHADGSTAELCRIRKRLGQCQRAIEKSLSRLGWNWSS